MLDNHRSIWPNFDDEKPYAVLVMGLVFIIFLSFVVKIVTDARTYQFIGLAPDTPNTITIVGEGKMTGAPDVAMVDLGVLSTSNKVSGAQADNTKKMNELADRLLKIGIKKDDMKTTQYYINPRYDYIDGRSVLAGYDVQQTLKVKIRDLDKVGAALSIAGEVGANQVGGLNITIDDPEPLRAAARIKAVTSARSKAAALAQSIGVKLGRVVSFSENSSDEQPPYMMKESFGVGGGGAPAPNIQSGSLEITSNVTLSYEIH
ncbi:hypothetical protein A3I40_00505 [Candidatus Uhrbacteria bacterium RIFCSPLOWO2_02_FULL_48_12]|uniref:SIMPL domain-containing protein n=1 Tax=Candidatus Uhrbacteria bacterium RIFCSPLOWO2_02_FULL_48_12 TaxID=1802407 RepID=A0A1F7V674_9BACT|nr:MAG: hypothetical protein A3I40_00505 [Candidatus Uhrbacteria bacterium RIFCSPLOWO2_02_FULL_48_12]